MTYVPVPLGEILRKAEDWVRLEPDKRYRQITMRLWGKGAVLRNEVSGAEIAAERRMSVRAGQLILSKIDARNGAIAIVPASLDGAVVSTDFPVFAVDPGRAIPAYLGWLARTRGFVDICRRASEGTTNRVRLQEGRFLAAQIALPPLEEQRRIVGRIEDVVSKVEEANSLREHSDRAASLLMSSALDAEFNRLAERGWPTTKVRDLEVLVTSGPRGFASQYSPRGARFYRAQDISADGTIDSAKTVRVEVPSSSNDRATVRAGDLLVVITGATIGRVAVITPEDDRGLVSQHVGLVRVDHTRVLPQFLLHACLAPSWAGGQLNKSKYGQGKPGLNLTNLRDLQFPLPSMQAQRDSVARLQRLSTKLTSLRVALRDRQRMLDNLLPSILDRAFAGAL